MMAENYAYPSVAASIPRWHYLRMDNLEHIREMRGLNQTQLATLVGTSQPTISKIEKGTANPTLEMINRIAKALKVHPSALFKLDPLRQRAFNAMENIEDPARQEAAIIVLESMADKRGK